MATQAVFGTINLHVTEISADVNPVSITETEIVADPSNPNSQNTILHGIGNKASKYKINGFCSASELSSLQTAKSGKTEYTLEVYVDGTKLIDDACIISSLIWSANSNEKLIRVTIDFIES